MFYEIFESDVLGFGEPTGDPFASTYHVRRAARGVLLDPATDRIAILYVSRNVYHKLPGGGMEVHTDGTPESYEEAFIREVWEETGCDSVITHMLGTTVEYRTYMSRLQVSRVYIAHLVGTPGQLHMTEEEREKGFELVWISIDDAIARMEPERPTRQHSKFVHMRDLAILREARTFLIR